MFGLILATSFGAFGGRAPCVGQPLVYRHGDPTDLEQAILERVNAARADPEAAAAALGIGLNDDLPPGTLSPEALPPLAFHDALIRAAREHSAWMLDSGVFSHQGRDGSSSRARMQDAGYMFGGSFFGSGENIALVTERPDRLTALIQMHENLLRSSSHRVNILDRDFVEIGLGHAFGSFDNGQVATDAADALTQDFAHSPVSGVRFAVGVAFHDRDGDGGYDPGEGLSGVLIEPDRGEWRAVTSSSGGYALPLDGVSGALTLRASGGALAGEILQIIDVGAGSVKADFLGAASLRLQLVPAGAEWRLRVENAATAQVRFEASDDLSVWSTHAIVPAVGGVAESPASFDGNQGFFRAAAVGE